MRLSFLTLFSILLLTLSVPAFGDQDLKGILEAIVKIRAVVPSNARTAGSLGTEREGAGAVIDSNGLILTIGYLILEAESIEVVSSDGKVLGATFIAYDDNTGFGLVRSKGPLEVTPFKLGHSAEVHPVEGLSDFYRKVWALGRAGVEVPLSILQGTEIRNITIRSGDRYKYFRLGPRRKEDYVAGFERELQLQSTGENERV